ncbi:MAG: 30S ribosome-binding factor RbfA [Candidatus Kerfeldbacteria bacterium]|nr:30S ribosome-binding factor RbfA [Candidatus Kerfeldbacteria bacterium]
MSFERVQRINALIREELGALIIRELELPPNLMITITGVNTSADLSYADISISALPIDRGEDALLLMTRAHKLLRKELAKKLRFWKMPSLRFTLDTTASHVDQIDALIDKIHEEG